ncbi:MAG: hypothetical protein ABWW69_06915 [Pyrodictiaceae archaeon]
MSLQWEPQWEEILVEAYGIRLRVYRDKITKLYACPVCGITGSTTYFFNIEDLIEHIIAHSEGHMKARVRVKAHHGEHQEPWLEE